MPFEKQSRPNQPNKPVSSRLRPGQDIMLPKPNVSFPNVGMTLSSYRSENASSTPRRGLVAGGAAAGVKPTKQPGRLRRFFRAVTLKRVVITLLIVVLGIGGWLGFKFAYNAHKIFGGSIF